MFDFLQLQREQVGVDPHVFVEISGTPITNTLLTAVLVTFVIAGLGWYARGWFQMIPGQVQNGVEFLYDEMLQLITQITSDDGLAREVFPLVAALFLYIGLANLITMLPGLGSLTAGGESLLRTPTSDINLPLALAAGSVILIQVRAIAQVGAFSYLGRYLKLKELVAGFRSSLKDGFLALVEFFVGLLDVVAEFAKIISLSFRLFGNMFAGELLAVLALSALAVGVPAVWMSFNLLFAVVQAVVFGALVTGYYALAVKPEGDVTEPAAELGDT